MNQTMNQTYELTIQASIRPHGNYSEGLRIEETATINASTFLELAKILGQFHDLAISLKSPSLRGGK